MDEASHGRSSPGMATDNTQLPPAGVPADWSRADSYADYNDSLMISNPSDEAFECALTELEAMPPVRPLPAGWSRADLYDDHD